MGDPEELLEECEEHVETHLSLEAAKKAAEKDLPRDGDERLWRLSAPRRQFARLGLGVFAYFSYLEAITYVFLALLLISTSNIVSNVSGGYYNRDELGLQSWLFAVTSIGNAVALSPAYGASEFVCAMLMVVFLYKREGGARGGGRERRGGGGDRRRLRRHARRRPRRARVSSPRTTLPSSAGSNAHSTTLSAPTRVIRRSSPTSPTARCA